MNYQHIYKQLIAKAKARSNMEGYVEKHHILPKTLGGSNQPENIVALTAREHFIAHMLLAKIYGGSMWYAVICMKGKQNRYVNSRLYNIARREQGIAFTGFKHTDAAREKIAIARKGYKHTDTAKRAIGFANTGNTFKHTTEAKLKIGLASSLRQIGKPSRNKGKPMSEAQKEKLRQVWVLKKQEAQHARMA